MVLRLCHHRSNRARRSWVLYCFRSEPSRYTFPIPQPCGLHIGLRSALSVLDFHRIHLVLYRLGCYNICMKKPFVSKICPSCNVEKPRSDYYKKGNGVSYRCKPCTLVDLKTRSANYFGRYKDYQNDWRRTRYQTDPAYREKISNQKRARYIRLKDELNEKRRERWRNDPFNPARKYHRRKDTKNRTPKWADQEKILLVYATCPPGHVVDHIVPLRGLVDGFPVTGLHVHYNLQHLPEAENRRKYNRISTEYLTTFVKR